MRKIVSFLALLVIAFALPDRAQAWTYNDGKDPSKIVLHLMSGATGDVEMKFDSSNADYSWSCAVVPTEATVKFTAQLWNQNQDYTITYGDNSVVAAAPNTWATASGNVSGGEYTQAGLTPGKKYRVEIAHVNDAAFKYRFVPDETSGPVEPSVWDLNTNTCPDRVVLRCNNGVLGEFELDYDADAKDYRWSATFIAQKQWLNFSMDLYCGDKEETGFGNNSGKTALSDSWVEVNLTDSNAKGSSYYHNGLTLGKRYRFELAGDGANKFKFRIVEVPGTVRLHLYSIDGDNVSHLGEAVWGEDGFNFAGVTLKQGTKLVLSRNAGATTVTGIQTNNGRYSPINSANSNLPTTGSDFRNVNAGYWTVTKDGTYTVTVDWANKKLNASVVETPSQTIYLYETNPLNQIASADPDTNGIYTFDNLDLAKGIGLVLSKHANKTAWTDIEADNGRYNPAPGTMIPGENIPFSQSTNGAWTTDREGKYTITVDWNNKKFTAVCDNDTPPVTDYPELYLYSSPWFTKVGTANADANGIYTYKVNLASDVHLVLSEISTAKPGDAWNVLDSSRFTPSNAQDHTIVSGQPYDFKQNAAGSWITGQSGEYTITVDWEKQTFTAVYKEMLPPDLHLPLTSADFEGKKHYFLVGERMGEWHLQPEWEFEVEGSELVLRDRYIYDSRFAVGIPASFSDYTKHTFDFYSAAETFTASKLESSGDISHNKQTMAQPKGETRNPVAGVFYAAFDGNYWQGRGQYMKEIRVTLNEDGLPVNIKFTPGTVDDASKNRVFTLVGDNIYNRSYSNHSGTGNTTMFNRGFSTVDGWQEGWIQFDPQTNKPYVDARGEYLYHTSFTPEYLMNNPVQFNMPLSDGSEFSFTSYAAQFIESSQLANLDKDPYKNFYKAFNGTETISDSEELIAGDGYNFKLRVENNNPTVTPTADWRCYVVRDMWVAGEVKFWSGWGGNSTTTQDAEVAGATWHGPNGGPDILKTERKLVKGYDVNAGGQEAVLYKNARNVDDTNYKVSEGDPVYFNRVVLWFNNTDGVGNSYIQFIQESAGPAIFAKAADNTETPGKKNYIAYNWYLNEAQNETDAALEVISYEINRYRVVDNVTTPIGSPEGDKVMIADVYDGTVTVSDLYEATAGNFPFTKHLDTGTVAGRGFAPGLYQYDIYVTYSNGARKLAMSNRVPIYDDDLVTPDAVAMQLVELRDAYTDLYGGEHASGKETLGVNKKYLTYRPNDNANFYVMDSEEIEITVGENDTKVKVTVPVNAEMIDAQKAIAFLNEHPDQYWWTSDYYVRCLDYNAYANTMQGYIDQGLVTGEDVPAPILQVQEQISYTDSEGEKSFKKSHGFAQPFDFGKQRYYSLIVKRGGNLADAVFDVQLRYTYLNADKEEVTPQTSAATQINPVVPRPFDPLYRYVYERPEGGLADTYQWGKILVPTQNWRDDNNSTDDAINLGLMKEVYVKMDEHFDARSFNLQVDFFRPNVNEDICKFYDIQYNIKMVNKASDVPLDMEAVLHDLNLEKPAERNRYRMEFKGMHPRNSVYPTVSFVKTEYVPREKSAEGVVGAEYKPQTGNFGTMLEIEAVRHVEIKENTGFTNVHLGKIRRENGTWDWMYKGHEDFVDDDEILNPTPDDGKLPPYQDPDYVGQNLAPLYYLIEVKGESADDNRVYEYLVPHVSGHNSDKANNDKVQVDPSTGLILNDSDPLIGTYIAKGLRSEATPTVVATAIYMFERPITGSSPEDVTNFNRLSIESIKFNKADGTSTDDTRAAQTPAARVKAGVSNSDLANGNAGGLPDTTVTEADGTPTAPEGEVLDMSATSDVTGYNNFIAVKGATYKETPSGTVTGVEDVLAGAEDGETVYYNLHGVRIDEPTAAGVYFRVRGREITKFVVK